MSGNNNSGSTPIESDDTKQEESGNGEPRGPATSATPESVPVKNKEPQELMDSYLVTFEHANDRGNPKTWPKSKKWTATMILGAFSFIGTLSSSMIGPALPQVADKLRITNTIEIEICLSIFVLAWAVGPFFLGPASETYGRLRVLQISNCFFLVWNIGCAAAHNKAELIVFRFLAGLGSSAQLAAGGGMLSDVWALEERGKAIAIYAFSIALGPTVGPVFGGWVAEKSTWRWVFWSTTIADAVVQVVAFFSLPETHASTILHSRAKRLRKETGDSGYHTEFGDKRYVDLFKIGLIRPFKMIATQPIIQALALFQAYLYGLFYLLFTSFSSTFEVQYSQSVGIASLHYIAIGIGFVIGLIMSASLLDRIYKALKARNGGVGRPEFRVPLMVPASILTPVGLLWFGWSAQARVHWIVPDIGICVFGIGALLAVQSSTIYIIDSYQRFAASGLAAVVMLRSIAGFTFPMFAPYMYAKLEYGWGNSLLALVGIVVGIPSPILLWFYGEKLRQRSPFAAG